jgi:hypothetical protein
VTPFKSATVVPLQSVSVAQPLTVEWHLLAGMSHVVFSGARVLVSDGHPVSVFAKLAWQLAV